MHRWELLSVSSFPPLPLPLHAFFLFVYFCLSSLNQQHQVELLPACEDNYALCSELIPMGRRLPVSLQHSWSQHVHFQLSCSALFNHRTSASHSHEFPIHLGASRMWINAFIPHIRRQVCILNALCIRVNPWQLCWHNWHHCGRLAGEHSITIPTSM